MVAARQALLSFYRRWRAEKVIDDADVDDYEANFRMRGSTKEVPKIEEIIAKLMSDPGSDQVLRKMMEFFTRHGQSTTPEAMQRVNEEFYREIAPLINMPTTDELGIRLDNFLDAELGEDHVETRRARALMADLYERWGMPQKAAEYVATERDNGRS